MRVFACLLASCATFACLPRTASAQTPPVKPAAAQVICHGDSLTWGANASAGQGKPGTLLEQSPGPVPAANSGSAAVPATTYPAVLARTLGPAWHVRSFGTGGWNFDPLSGEAPTKIDPLFDPNLTDNVLIIFGGTNDMGGAHRTAEQAFEKLTNYCRARKAAHPWRILVVTPPMAAYPRVYPADFDAQMVKYNALIRRNWPTFADGIVDIAADYRLGNPGAERNSLYFSPQDFTHLTDAGYAIIGQDAAAAVLQLPPPSAPASK